MNSDMFSNKKLHSVVAEFFVRGRKLNISYVFYHAITFFEVPKNVRLNTIHLFYYENSKQKRTLQITYNY